MNFIIGFRKVHDCCSIFVVIDRFLKYDVFVPTQDACLVDKETKLLFSYLVKYFRLPQDTVSERNVRFMGRF